MSVVSECDVTVEDSSSNSTVVAVADKLVAIDEGLLYLELNPRCTVTSLKVFFLSPSSKSTSI